jgi:hypothetical protein
MKTQSIKLAYLLKIGTIIEVDKNAPNIHIEPKFLTEDYTIYNFSLHNHLIESNDFDFISITQSVKKVSDFISNTYMAFSV